MQKYLWMLILSASNLNRCILPSNISRCVKTKHTTVDYSKNKIPKAKNTRNGSKSTKVQNNMNNFIWYDVNVTKI